MQLQKLYRNLAAVTVKCGLNVKQGDILMINSPIEVAEFARLIARKAYELGCKQVVMHWNDQMISKLKYQYESVEELSKVPNWMVETYTDYLANPETVCNLSIIANDPQMFKDIDSSKIAIASRARQQALQKYYEMAMSNNIRWCVVSVPLEQWANQVFPDSQNAMKLLTQNLLDVCLCNFDTEQECINAWENYNQLLHKRSAYMNQKRYKYLSYSSQKTGTNLKLELNSHSLWQGGPGVTTNEDKRQFNPNIPSYEIFSAPQKDGVNGIVYASLPLVHGGKIVKGFWFKFEKGVVVDFGAEENVEVLKEILNTDEGSRRLGEVALVPVDSPISQKQILFMETLFDENASCHLALGRAYEDCCDNDDHSWQNNSSEHVDFMIGCDDMFIVGQTQDGVDEIVMKDGKFVF